MANKPSAILIGDSICMGYRPLVKERLSEKVNILGVSANGGDSSNMLKNLDEWMISREADLIHFNCGLHDLKLERNATTHQQPLEAYESNLRKIVERLQKETKTPLAWATSTPVIDERHSAVKGFDRHLTDVQAYNKVATAIMTEAGIPIDDLYSVIQNDDVEMCISADGVHMTQRGNSVLTDMVCRFIQDRLGL